MLCRVLVTSLLLPAATALAAPRLDVWSYGGLDSTALTLPNPQVPKADVRGASYGLGISADLVTRGAWTGFVEVGYFGFWQEATLRQNQFGNDVEGEFSSALSGIDAAAGVAFLPLPSLRASVAGFGGMGIGGELKAKIGLIDATEKVKSMFRYGAQLATRWEMGMGLSLWGALSGYSASITTKSNSDYVFLADPSGKPAPAKALALSYRLGVAFRAYPFAPSAQPPSPPPGRPPERNKGTPLRKTTSSKPSQGTPQP